MQAVKNQSTEITRLSEGPKHNFYGYYDLQAWDRDGKNHLVHKVDFADRLPLKEDKAQLGMINIDNRSYTPIAETTAWNFQQGSFLQWNPGVPDEVVFNTRLDEEYRGVIKNIKNNSSRLLDKPVANISPDGRHALSINFDRLFDFRPGYGYAGRKDVYADMERPEDDGIFLVNMKTGKSKLIISLCQIHEMLQKQNSPVANGKIVINAISFNTDGSRFVFLVRDFPAQGNTWRTAVMTANADGKDMYLLNDYSLASHYHWRDAEYLLMYARHKYGDQLYVFKDKTQEIQIVDAGYFLKDGHCSYSPDRNWILYDSYPDREGYRSLYLYNIANSKGITLASLYSYPVTTIEIRCDLHPRWHPSGKAITFDSTHENHRHIYHMNLEEVIRTFGG